MPGEDKKAQRIFRIAKFATVFWMFAGLLYAVGKWCIVFGDMQPGEWGEFLTGWFAPLALIWAGVAGWFQWQEFNKKTEELQKESKRVQDEFDKSKQDKETGDIERYLEKLGKEIQVLLRTCEKCELHKSGKEPESLSDVVGDYELCAGIANSKNYQHLLSEVGNGLRDFAERVNNESEDWMIGADDDELAHLAAAIDALKGPIDSIIKAQGSGATSHDAPTTQVMTTFQRQVDGASELVNGILAAYKTLGDDPKGDGVAPSRGAHVTQTDQPKILGT